jgi:hypothetical protein
VRAGLYASADDLLDDFIAEVRKLADDDVWLQTADIAGLIVWERLVRQNSSVAMDDVLYAMSVVLATAVQRLAREQP